MFWGYVFILPRCKEESSVDQPILIPDVSASFSEVSVVAITSPTRTYIKNIHVGTNLYFDISIRNLFIYFLYALKLM